MSLFVSKSLSIAFARWPEQEAAARGAGGKLPAKALAGKLWKLMHFVQKQPCLAWLALVARQVRLQQKSVQQPAPASRARACTLLLKGFAWCIIRACAARSAGSRQEMPSTSACAHNNDRHQPQARKPHSFQREKEEIGWQVGSLQSKGASLCARS